MKEFLNTKTNDLTIGQSLGFTALVTVVSFTPFIVATICEKIRESRHSREYDE